MASPDNGKCFDPQNVAAELSSKLAARSRHVCILLGAGTTKAAGLLDITQLKAAVLNALAHRRDMLEPLFENRTLEDGLSRLRRIRTLLEGQETFAGLTREAADDLDREICDAIIEALDIKKATIEPFVRFASWAARSDYHQPIEVFTVNYDLGVETGFEEVGAMYFDGFVGELNARFRPDLVESEAGHQLPSFFVRLWKLHGSANWSFIEKDGHRIVVRRGTAARDGGAAAIYPSEEKYDDSRRVPFITLMDRFRRALAEPETLTLVSGYSFQDQHLNEILFDAALRHPRSEIVVFCFSKLPDILAAQASRTRNLTVLASAEAILGGARGAWKADAEIPGIWESGKFVLGDFSQLATFLAGSTGPTNA